MAAKKFSRMTIMTPTKPNFHHRLTISKKSILNKSKHRTTTKAKMKYTALFTASTLVVATSAQIDQRNLATLAEKWNLTDPTFVYDSNTFSLTFPVTDFINSGMAQYSLWTAPDCQSDGGTSLDGSNIWATTPELVENAALLAASVFGTAGTQLDSGVFNGREATINAAFDPQTISQSDIYVEEVIDNQVIAEIRFCIRFGLWTTEQMVNTPVEVNFLETLVTLTVDLTDGFEIGAIEVEPKDRLVRTANQAYEVRGYECTADSFDPLSEAQRLLPRNQGEIIHVCVTPEDEAQTDGIFMRSVDDFAFTRGADIRQVAVEANREAGNLLTTYDFAACEGTLVCRFSTILFAQFYATPGTVTGEGVASMQFGDIKTGDTRRQLRVDRALQAADGAGAAEFDLTFEVAEATARTGSGAGSTPFGVGLSVAAIAAVATLL